MGHRIVLEDVHYSYPGSRRPALRGATLTLEPGRVTWIAGPNGSGKTTLLLVAALLLEPRRGRVLVDGSDPWRQRRAENLRGSIVYVPEKPLILRGTVLENIMLGPLLRGATPGEAERAAVEAAEALGIRGLLGRDARRLSAGEKALASIARALAARPRALLLDEPYANLDPSRRRLLTRVLRGLAREGVLVALASHDAAATRAADKAVLLVDGRVAASGPPQRVMEELA